MRQDTYTRAHIDHLFKSVTRAERMAYLARMSRRDAEDLLNTISAPQFHTLSPWHPSWSSEPTLVVAFKKAGKRLERHSAKVARKASGEVTPYQRRKEREAAALHAARTARVASEPGGL